MVEFQLTK